MQGMLKAELNSPCSQCWRNRQLPASLSAGSCQAAERRTPCRSSPAASWSASPSPATAERQVQLTVTFCFCYQLSSCLFVWSGYQTRPNKMMMDGVSWSHRSLVMIPVISVSPQVGRNPKVGSGAVLIGSWTVKPLPFFTFVGVSLPLSLPGKILAKVLNVQHKPAWSALSPSRCWRQTNHNSLAWGLALDLISNQFT